MERDGDAKQKEIVDEGVVANRVSRGREKRL